MPLRILALLLATVVSQDSPVITAASWAAVSFSNTFPCPQNLPWDCDLGAIRVTILGNSFGPSGAVEVAAPIAPNAPVAPPIDLPDALNIITGGLAPFIKNGCLIPSDAASFEYGIEVCPFATSYLRARGGGPRVASLGAFSGVVRTDNPECSDPPATQAVTGLLFTGGDLCGAGTRSARVNFVCITEDDPWQLRYLNNVTVYAASRSQDGCQWQLDIPIVEACPDDFDLCSTTTMPAPNVSPTSSPSPALSPAFQSSWSPNAIVILVRPGTAPPSALKVRRSGDATSVFGVPIPEPLPPSFSPIPQPFPTTLTVLGATPNAAISSTNSTDLPCTPVTISLAGVLPIDLLGFGASFEIIFPRGPLENNSAVTLFGSPVGANNTATLVPSNGRLDLLLECAPKLMEFPTPFTGNFYLRSRYLAIDPNVPNDDPTPPDNPFITRRVATCATPTACSWTFWGPVAPTLSPSPVPPAPPAANQAALPPAALYGIIGGSSFLALALGVGAFLYFCYCARKSAEPATLKAPAGAEGGEKAVANPLANVTIVQEVPSSPSASYNDLPGTPTSSAASIQEWSK